MVERKEYIERGALLQDIEENVLFTVRGDVETPTPEMRGARKVIGRIEAAPTINPDDLRPRGQWIQHNKENNNWVECSECNTVGSPFWKCCPVCTAMMNSAADNNVGCKTDGKEKS